MIGKISPFELLPIILAAPLIMLSACGSSSGSNNSADLQKHGTCIWQNFSLPVTTQASAGPSTILAPLSFDGAGHVSFDYYVNINGTFSVTLGVTGTYQMGPGGHGSMTYTSPASSNTLVLDLYLTPDGHAIRLITQAYANQPVPLRVGSGLCRFDE